MRLNYDRYSELAKMRRTSPAYLVKLDINYREGGATETPCGKCKNFQRVKFVMGEYDLCHLVGINPMESYTVAKDHTCNMAQGKT